MGKPEEHARVEPVGPQPHRRWPVRAYLLFTGILAAGGLLLGFAPLAAPAWTPATERWREVPPAVEILVSLVLLLAPYEIYRRAPVKFRWLAVTFSLLASCRYLSWRIGHSLNFATPANTAACLLLLGAEVYAILMLVLGHFQTFWPRRRKTPAMPRGVRWPSVDVFITTYNEDVDLVRRTAVGCAALDYPDKKVWILDDGRRPAMKALAAEVGVGYITRPDNRHAKAGNLNHALGVTSGELIAQFDADHVPVASFLKETVPFFIGRAELAFVQTPHHFYNHEAYQRNLVLGNRVANEQDYFFHVIQPGNDRWNAAFFCGSNAVLRRAALASVGGFATETVTEDAHTALRLHARGWRSFYLDRNLAGGLAPECYGDLLVQRLRWGQGMSSILKVDNPLALPGLSVAQRICYLSSSLFFFFGVPRLIFLLAPVLYLLTGVSPIDSGVLMVATYYLPHFLAGIFVTSAVSRNLRHTFWSEVYETALAFPMALSILWAMLARRRLPFKVTPKEALQDSVHFNFRAALPQAVLLILTLLAMIAGGRREAGRGEWAGVLAMNLFWCTYNVLLLAPAVLVAVDRPQKRKDPRVPCFRPVDVQWSVKGRELRTDGVAVDLCEGGARLLARTPVAAAVPLVVRLDPHDDPLDLPARLLHIGEMQADGSFDLSVHFDALDSATRHRLIRRMYGDPRTWVAEPEPEHGWRSFGRLLGTVFRWGGTREAAFLRGAHRFPCVRPGVIRAGGQELAVVVAELSQSGAFLTGEALARLRLSRCVVAFGLRSGRSLSVRCRIVGRRSHGVAVAFDGLSPEVRSELLWDLYVAPLREVRRAGAAAPDGADVVRV